MLGANLGLIHSGGHTVLGLVNVRHELHRPSRTQHPSGVLWLVLEAESGRRALKDGGRKTLEEKLAEAPQVLRWMAARAKQYRMEFEEQRKGWEEEARLREIRERQQAEARAEQERQQAELRAREERFRTLLGRWRLARDTRAYVLEARGLLDAADLVSEQKAELAAQLEWASQYAERIDLLWVSGDRKLSPRRRSHRTPPSAIPHVNVRGGPSHLGPAESGRSGRGSVPRRATARAARGHRRTVRSGRSHPATWVPPPVSHVHGAPP